MKASRFTRLLPGVIALGAAVLVLKGTDLVHEAYAQAAGQMSALSGDPVPANKDYAGADDDQAASASQVDVLNSLSRRRHELDARENQLNIQANILAAAEARVDAKIAQLKQLQSQISGLITLRDDEQKKQIAGLIKTYGPDGMKPAKAAAIFNSLPDDVLIPVAQGMKPGDLGAILAQMNAEAAQKLTVKLANRLTLPQTTDASAPQPAPGPVAALNPVPAPAAQAQPAEPPVKKRVRKAPPPADTTASAASPSTPVTAIPVTATPETAPAPAASLPAAQTVPASPAPQESQTQPKS